MKNKLKQHFGNYLNSAWRPSVLVLACLLLYGLCSWWKIMDVLAPASLFLVGLALLGLPIAGCWNLFRKRWNIGIANLIMFPILGGVSYAALAIIAIASVYGPSEDSFGKDLKIPKDLAVTEPLARHKKSRGGEEDPFQQAMLASVATSGNGDPSVTPVAAKMQSPLARSSSL